jgi:hypothetical protein
MKKILCGLLLFGSLAMRAQVSNPSIISVATAPSGACSPGLPNQQVISTGVQYSCQVGTWAAIAGGGGGATTFDQIGSGTNLGQGLVVGAGSVLAPSGGGFISANELNGTLLSGLGTGLLTNATGTGAPTITSPSTTVNGQTCTLGSTCTIAVGTGTVTSVSGLSPLFTTSNATTTPTFALSSAAQNSVFAGPVSGGTGAPSYRAIANSDLPGTGSTTVNGTACTLAGSCTVAAAAGTLTGTTLAANVVSSSLTSAAGGSFGTAAFTAASAYAPSTILSTANSWTASQLFKNDAVIQGDTSATPSTLTEMLSTNSGSTAGITAGLSCAIQHTFISGVNYTAWAICGGFGGSSNQIFFYVSGSLPLGSESFALYFQYGNGALSLLHNSNVAGSFVASANMTAAAYFSGSNCASAASPAVCVGASAGAFTIAAGATSVTVNTTAVTINSEIEIQPDSSLGTRLGVTCNTSLATVIGPVITARTAGTSFTVSITGTLVANPACYTYSIIN